MVRIKLYGQPRELKPMLNKQAYLTNIGYALISTLKEMGEDPKASIFNVDDSTGEADILIKSKHLTVAMGLRFLEADMRPENSYVIFEVEGDRYSVYQLVKQTYSKLRYRPYDILKEDSFERKAGVSEKEVRKAWEEALATDPAEEVLRRKDALKKMLLKAGKIGVETADESRKMEAIEKAIKSKRYSDASALITLTRNTIAEKITRYQQEHIAEQDARDILTNATRMVHEASLKGFDMGEENGMLDDARSALSNGNLKRAVQLAKEAMNSVERKKNLIEAMRNRLVLLERKIDEERSAGTDISRYEGLLSRCWLFYRDNDLEGLENSMESLQQMLDEDSNKKKMLLSMYQKAKQNLKEATFVLIEAKKVGIRSDDLEELLKKAERLVVFNEYDEAARIAEMVISEATDRMNSRDSIKMMVAEIDKKLSLAEMYMDTSWLRETFTALKDELQEHPEINGSVSEITKRFSSLLDDIDSALSSAEPKLVCSLEDINVEAGSWTQIKHTIENAGTGHARDVTVEYEAPDGVEVMGPDTISEIKAGQKVDVEVGIRCPEEGEFPLRAVLKYQSARGSQQYSQELEMKISSRRPGFMLEETMEIGKKVEIASELEKDSRTRDLITVMGRLDSSLTYYTGSDTTKFYRLASLLVKGGKRVLIVSRQFPKKIYAKYKIPSDACNVIWLSKEDGRGSDDVIKPNDLEKLRHTIDRYLDENKGLYVFLDGIEYLSVHNNFEYVIKFIQSITDRIAIKEGTLLITFDPGALGEEESRLLQRECDETLEL